MRPSEYLALKWSDIEWQRGTASVCRTIQFRKLLALAGIRSVRLYDLCHTAATLAIAAGVSVKVISDQLGHARISFTLERYSHVLPSIQDEATAKVEQLLVA